MNFIDIKTNNNGIMRITKTDTNIARDGIILESIDSNGKVYRGDFINEGDFVMLMNYYRYIKDNDIQDDFINRNGTNSRENYFSEDLEM